MRYEDIELARAHHAALVRLFSSTLSPHDARLAPEVLRTCWGAWTAVDNVHCRARIRKLVEYASALFAPRPQGVPVILAEQALNDKIRRMLDSYARWLDYLQAAREANADLPQRSRGQGALHASAR